MSTLSYRKILRSEREDYANHLKRLGNEDRVLRFETHISDEAIDKYVNGIRFSSDAVFGAFDNTLTMRGAAHISLDHDVADLGLSVESNWRGFGAGSTLFERAITHARLKHAKKFTSMCLAHNRWMLRHAREHGFTVTFDGGVAMGTAKLEPPDVLLVQQALLDEQFGWMDYGTKLWFNLIPIPQNPR